VSLGGQSKSPIHGDLVAGLNSKMWQASSDQLCSSVDSSVMNLPVS
jgi:hypothetical protein